MKEDRVTKNVRFVKLVILALFITVYNSFTIQADDTSADGKNPHVWKGRVTSVAVFKNGLGFFTRQGKVDLREGWCITKQVPPAAFGTLAIYSENPEHLVDIVGAGPGEIVEFNDEDAPSDLKYKRQRLEAIQHLKVQLSYRHKGANRTAAGTLISVGPEFVVLETENNSFAVPVKGIFKMQVLELPLRIHVEGDDQATPKQTELGMAYLRKGITWIPEYTVKILDDANAELTLRGTLVNEAEDLIHCDVNFVVGVPHFLHTNYMAPIAVGQVIRTIGSAVAPAAIRTQIANRAAIARNDIRADQFSGYGVVDQPIRPNDGNLKNAMGNLPQMGGAAGTDYTVYTKKDVTLRRGEKAIVTLFVKKIKYSHIYRWAPPERMKHFLVLHNQTDTAWTTGPFLAISNQKPLSEDLLKYTPKGGKCEIPVTEAVNISTDKNESEVDRKLKAHSPRRDIFLDLVTLKGELQLRNFEKRPVEIVIDVSIPGKPVSATEDGIFKSDPTKLKLSQRAGSIHWNIQMKTGERKKLEYQYERYVSSH